MRSVLVHLGECTEGDVADALAAAYPAQAGPPWIQVVDGDPCLYIDHYREHFLEFESGELEALLARFEGRLPISLVADVSGRHDGSKEVHQLVEALLSRWPGLASDDASDHLWTLDEIRTGSAVTGRRFFAQAEPQG